MLVVRHAPKMRAFSNTYQAESHASKPYRSKYWYLTRTYYVQFYFTCLKHEYPNVHLFGFGTKPGKFDWRLIKGGSPSELADRCKKEPNNSRCLWTKKPKKAGDLV